MVGRAVLVVAALVVAPLLAACSGSDDAAPRPTPSPTPISKLDAGTVRLARAEFCDRLPGSAVPAALGGKAQSHASWGNGDPVPDAAGESGDVGHELGCSWTGADGAAARAWVFARPVSAAFASQIVRQAGHQAGCTTGKSPTFGNPAILQTCTAGPPNGVSRVRRAGLFGDTWLTCEVAGTSAPDLTRRTDRWCAAVVSAARTD
jgi:hypothetical protein